MQYASEGDLHNILRKKFTEITWDKQKLAILWQISEGLETIHKSDFIHRDFHSGNILSNLSNGKRHQWQIGDLGLSQPVNNTQSNNEIYGVIPYVAPEIFKGTAFSKESDIYCVDRPEITEDTPECYAELMKRCWDSDPTKRPLITEIRKTFGKCCSSIFSQDYNSIELELDIDIKSSNILGTKRNIEELEINSYGNSGKHIKN
ncbi:unnamed protein product [Rhizophagus irregularis]|nr:unnamed protein product [Rhizophagus irregularis]